ncbi:MAG: hypothetical protein LBK95_16355 [Bifidobacteriaceae bacterium]|nr:hypothetical protein [Bifidobacteriaceae bacterium]
MAVIPSGAALGAPASDGTVTVAADGIEGIADASHNDLFGGDARQGVSDLIAAGAVRINDVTVPVALGQDAYSVDQFDINGGRALWKNADGTWSWNIHPLFSGSDQGYEEAVVAFVNGVTMLRGITYDLTISSGVVTGLDARVFDVVFANTVTRGTDYTTITLVEPSGVTARPDPSTIQFPNANVEGAPQSQDMVLYWNDGQGWHLEQATSEEVVLTANIPETGSIFGTVNGEPMVDSLLTLASSPWNRPSQPIRGIVWMDEGQATVIQWTCAPGITVGFSRGERARAALEAALDKAQEALATTQVSAAGDGTDVASGELWVTQEYRTIFTQAVADARAAYDNDDLTNSQYEGALYRLAQAYGGRTGDRFSALDNPYFGSGSGYDTGYNGTGFWTFAQAHEGTLNKVLLKAVVNNMGEGTTATNSQYDDYFDAATAEAGVAAIIAAGRFFINGFALPGTEAEYTATWPDGYALNQSVWLAKSGNRWKGGNGGATFFDTYDEAALSIANAIPAGLEVRLYDTDEDGFADLIETLYLGAVIADTITENADGTYTIARAELDPALTYSENDGTPYSAAGGPFSAGWEQTVKPENFDSNIQKGDMALYYYGPDGWVVSRAIEIHGMYMGGEDHRSYQIDDVLYYDAMRFPRGNLLISSRNGEFANGHNYFGFNNNPQMLKISFWLAPTTDYPATKGAPLGFTTKGNGGAFLTRALAIAREKLNSVAVSTDGKDVPVGTKWTTQAMRDELSAAIDRAARAKDLDQSPELLDYQVYLLYLTLAGSAADIGATTSGYDYVGFDTMIFEGTRVGGGTDPSRSPSSGTDSSSGASPGSQSPTTLPVTGGSATNLTLLTIAMTLIGGGAALFGLGRRQRNRL